jgi:hypothetical protein
MPKALPGFMGKMLALPAAGNTFGIGYGGVPQA